MEGNLLILRNWDEYFFLLKKPCGYDEYSFLLNMHEESLKENYRKLSTLKINFSVALDVSEPLNEKQLQTILSFLFLPYYQTPVIYVNVDDDELYANTNFSFLHFFKDQNKDISLVRIQQGGANLADLKSSGKTYVACNSLNEVQAFQKSNQPHTPVQDEAGLLRNENKDLQKRIKLLTAELEIQKTYNEKLRTSHHAQEIQSYYDNQYEILPAWYKKIGNILKRLMKLK